MERSLQLTLFILFDTLRYFECQGGGYDEFITCFSSPRSDRSTQLEYIRYYCQTSVQFKLNVCIFLNYLSDSHWIPRGDTFWTRKCFYDLMDSWSTEDREPNLKIFSRHFYRVFPRFVRCASLLVYFDGRSMRTVVLRIKKAPLKLTNMFDCPWWFTLFFSSSRIVRETCDWKYMKQTYGISGESR